MVRPRDSPNSFWRETLQMPCVAKPLLGAHTSPIIRHSILVKEQMYCLKLKVHNSLDIRIYIFERNHTKVVCILRLLPKDQNWDIRGFILESHLTNVMNIIMLFIKHLCIWINRIHAGQEVYKYIGLRNTIKIQCVLGIRKNPYKCNECGKKFKQFSQLTHSKFCNRYKSLVLRLTCVITYSRIIISQTMLKLTICCMSQGQDVYKQLFFFFSSL